MEEPARRNKLSKALSAVILLAVLGAVAALFYVVSLPQPRKPFTEFYLLGAEGKAVDYPTKLRVNEAGKLILGISNWEQETVSYRVETRIGGVTTGELGPILLAHGDRFEQEVSFTPHQAGEKQRVEFLLYKQNASGICDSLYLLVNVEE